MSLLAADLVHNTRVALDHVLARLKDHFSRDARSRPGTTKVKSADSPGNTGQPLENGTNLARAGASGGSRDARNGRFPKAPPSSALTTAIADVSGRVATPYMYSCRSFSSKASAGDERVLAWRVAREPGLGCVSCRSG